MTGGITCSVEIGQLQNFVSGLQGALWASGQGGDSQRILRVSTGQLAGRIGDSVGPKSLEQQSKRIVSEIRNQMTVFPVHENIAPEHGESSYADFRWISAGSNFVVGIAAEDDQVRASGASAYQMYRAASRHGSRGKSQMVLGVRGKDKQQSVKQVNRIRISSSAFHYIQQQIRNTTGELRAAFYQVAVTYNPKRRVPGWLARKFEAVVAKGKSSSHDSLDSGPESFIEFTIKAPGVVSNDRLVIKIKGAIGRTAYIAAAKMKKILSGYKYNWETGQVFRPSPISDMEDSID